MADVAMRRVQPDKELRQMHLANESMKESKSSLVVPTAYADGFTDLAEK